MHAPRLPWLLALALAAPVSFARAQDKPETRSVPAPAAEKKADDRPAAPAEKKADDPFEVPANTAIAPEPRPGAWVRRHEAFLEQAKKGDVDLLFLGDSITAGWAAGAAPIWSRYYAPRKAANFGIGGDRTQHVLWRLENGEVDGIRPRVVVLMIGTNNLGRNTEAEAAEGVKAVVARLREKLPEAKVLLLGVLPRGLNRDKSQVSTSPDPRVARINRRLAGLADGKSVKYLDIGVDFLDDSGQIPGAIMPDYLHLARKGYQAWADAIEPALWEMMDEKRQE